MSSSLFVARWRNMKPEQWLHNKPASYKCRLVEVFQISLSPKPSFREFSLASTLGDYVERTFTIYKSAIDLAEPV